MPYRYLAQTGLLLSPITRRLLVGLALLGPLAAHAQGRVPVSGTVSSAAGAVEFATVTLHRATDSTVIKTEFTDGAGHFRFEAASGPRYLVSAAQVGFVRYWSPVFELTKAGMELPTVRLPTSQATALKEVTVMGRKPLFEHLADRTVVNVAASPLSAGATALDVLGRSPGVTLDAGDNLGLRGRQGLLVVIDGKRVPLTGTELADYLKALPAEQLQSIELITNPPAQYDAQGGAGVIAINLKKDQRMGTNGSANASYGRGEYGKFTGGLTLNHRRKNVNIYGTYAYSERRGFLRLNFYRQFSPTPISSSASSALATEQLTLLRSHSAKAGADFTLSKRTTLGLSATALASQTDYSTTNQTQFFGSVGEFTQRYHSTAAQDVNRPNGSANLNLRHVFADSATAASLAADMDYALYHTTRLLALNTYYEEPTQPAALLSGNQRSDLRIATAKLDFSQPLPHRTRLEAGVKATQVTSDNTVAFERARNGVTAFDSAISNQFQYRENVNAAYVSLRGAGAKTTFQAGLRAEQTNTRADLSGENRREQHYLQLFPSATVQHTLSARQTVGLSAARRIDRPSYVQVNPLRNYFDATSYRAGNPDLVAQTSYNVELTHTYRQKFVTSLAYAHTNLPIVNVVQPSPDGARLVVNQDVNLTTQRYYALTLTAPLDLAKWWSVYANGVLFYTRFVSNLNGTDLNNGQVTAILTVNSSFTLTHGWSADVSGFYESQERYGFQVIRPRGQVGAGVQKSLWNKQATLRLNVADIFYTTPNHAVSTYTNFTESFRRGEDLRVATAAFTYRFGSSKVAGASKRAVGADDELRRAGGQ